VAGPLLIAFVSPFTTPGGIFATSGVLSPEAPLCAMLLARGRFDARREEIGIMVQAGNVFENPVSGQRLIFRKTARDTGGELLEVESVYTKPSPSRPPAHYHPRQEEHFEVLSGEVHALIGGQERTLREGDVFIVPPRVPHGMWAEEAGTRVKWQTRPALKTEAFFETVWGLARDGKVNDRGVPNLLRAALIARDYQEEYRLVSLSRAVQKVLFGLLAPVGRLLGYPARYPYPYGGPENGLRTEAERSSVAFRTRIGGILSVAILVFLMVFLLRRLHRQSRG
jgi:quercetin dioxygenase-like cupin family protein